MCQAARMRRSGRICGGFAGICAFAQLKIVQHPEPARTKIRVGSVFCLSTMDLLAKVCLRNTSFQRDTAGVPLPGARTREPSPACAQRHGACRRHIPRRTQMEAAGWAPAADDRKYLRKQLFDRMQQNIGMCRSTCIAAPATSDPIRRGLPIVCGRGSRNAGLRSVLFILPRAAAFLSGRRLHLREGRAVVRPMNRRSQRRHLRGAVLLQRHRR